MEIVLDEAILGNIYMKKDRPRAANSDVNWALGLVPDDSDGDKTIHVYNSFNGCKDYLNDTIANYIHGRKEGIYSRGGWLENTTLPEDHLYIALQSTRVSDITEGIKKFINPMEERAGLEPTVVTTTAMANIIVLQADRNLLRDGFLMSAWYMLVRSMFFSKEYKVTTIEEFVVSHSTHEISSMSRRKDGNYMQYILEWVEPSFFCKFLSLTEEFVLTSKELKKVLVDNNNTVHEFFGIMEMVLFLSDKTHRESRRQQCINLLHNRYTMVMDMMAPLKVKKPKEKEKEEVNEKGNTTTAQAYVLGYNLTEEVLQIQPHVVAREAPNRPAPAATRGTANTTRAQQRAIAGREALRQRNLATMWRMER